MSRAKRWCFTLNNYTDEEHSGILRCLRSTTEYFIIGKEIGESGTPHLQGYTVFKRRYRLTQVKAELGRRAHIEISRGTPSDNRVYCSKGGDYEEGGTCPSDGEGSKASKDRDELAREWRSRMEHGRSGLDQFAVDNPGTYYFHRSTLLRNSMGHARAVPRPGVTARWYWGPPGVGKSRLAHEQMPDAYIKEPRTKWWNGYMMEKDVIIDDFGPNGIDINHLLRWFDRYKCYVEIKGDMCPLFAENFIVTSNFHPTQLFLDKDGCVHKQIEALLRRLELIEMN